MQPVYRYDLDKMYRIYIEKMSVKETQERIFEDLCSEYNKFIYTFIDDIKMKYTRDTTITINSAVDRFIEKVSTGVIPTLEDHFNFTIPNSNEIYEATRLGDGMFRIEWCSIDGEHIVTWTIEQMINKIKNYGYRKII